MRRIVHQVYSRADAVALQIAEDEKLRFERSESWPTEATVADLDALPGDVVVRAMRTARESDHLLQRSGALVLCNLDGGRIRVQIWAERAEVASEVLDEVHRVVPRSVMVGDELHVTFWSLGPNGPMGIGRKVTAPDWDQVAGNYAASTWEQMERLRAMRFDPVSGGKLLLWHGEPGTGKTYALRALAREWRRWLEVHYIVDPERFFGKEAAYLVTVLLGESGPVEPVAPVLEVAEPAALPELQPSEQARPPKWRLIVLEDTGELLTTDAKERSGQALSRLLNVCDGMIGQGLRVLVLITTNEDLGALHPAVTRPGRCAANVTFASLSAAESTTWLEVHDAEPNYALATAKTLAELYAIAAGEPAIEPVVRRRVGFAR